MELESAKMIAAALALLPILGVGIGLGSMFGSYFEAVGRNPSAEEKISKKLIMLFAFVEALGIFALLVSFMIMFM